MLTTDTNSQAQELARYFRAAAEQRRLLEPRRIDRRWVAEGKTVLHAVDVDVVKLFTNPFEMAIRTDRRHYGYGEVFPGDDRNIAIGVGRVLAHFIFFQLGGQNAPPLLLLPPIDQELREVFLGVTRDAMLEAVKTREQVSEVQRLAVQVAKMEDEEECTRCLVQVAPDLFRFLAGTHGPRAELERFSRLAGKGCIVFLDQVQWGNEVRRQAFHPAESPTDQFSLNNLAHLWFKEISKTATRRKSSSRIQDDAMMLARLEWINRRLGDDTRLVLITGDQSIHGAARTYVPENEKRDFADLWLRHPRSYLAEPEVLSPEAKGEAKAQTETDFIKWLDTFLGKLEISGPDYMVALEKLRTDPSQELVRVAAKVLESHPSILDDFKTRWSEYSRRAILAHGFEDEPEIGDSQRIAELVRTISEQLHQLEEFLGKQVAEKWNLVFKAAIEAGFLFARQHRTGRSRNPPVLYFKTFATASNFIRKIIATEQQDQIDNFEKDLEELRSNDPSDYTYTLAFGILFAAQGAWGVAAILGERALGIALAIKGENYITGREAYYLQAVARRHQIRKAADLAEVDSLLNKAEECLQEERKERADLLEGDFRFAAERVALNVSYRLFERFNQKEIPDTVPSLEEIKSSLMELLAQNAAGLSFEDDTRRWVARNVERRLLTNLFMVALRQSDHTQPFPQALAQYFEHFKLSVEGKRDEEPIPRTFFDDAVYLVTCWWKETEFTKKKMLRSKVQFNLRDEEIERNAVMPYDKSRFRYLRNFVSADQ